MKKTVIGIALTAALVLGAVPAQAEPNCGWYAIAMCSKSHERADAFANKSGWGEVLITNNYQDLREGYYCVVSGPQSRANALADRDDARDNGISDSTYVKRACHTGPRGL
jgi:hypothetical protein